MGCQAHNMLGFRVFPQQWVYDGIKTKKTWVKLHQNWDGQNDENTHIVLDAIGIHKLVGENSSQVKFDAGDDIKIVWQKQNVNPFVYHFWAMPISVECSFWFHALSSAAWLPGVTDVSPERPHHDPVQHLTANLRYLYPPATKHG